MTEKHKWISDNLSLIEETTGIKLYGTVCTDITFIAKQLNDANETLLRLEKENEQLKEQLSEQRIQIDFLEAENQHMRELINENKRLKQDKEDLISYIKKEFPKSHKHILEGFE